jgi:tetratricopeptide (TPR) repeat protein
VAALGLWLLAVVTFSWLAMGGVHHGTRAGLHLALALGFGIAAGLADRSLAYTGRMLPLAWAGGALLAACAVGLLPLPRAALAVVAPGTLSARPDAAWWTLSLDPEATVGELCDLALPLGAMVLAGAWGAAWWRRPGIERAVRTGLLLVAGVALAHALTGQTLLFGLIPTSLQPGQRFFAPFIDPNHTGTAVALLLPSAAAVALDPGAQPRSRLLWGAATAVAIGGIVWIRSSGALAAAGVAVALVAWRVHQQGGGSRRALLGGAAGIGLLGLLGVAWLGLADQGAGATLGDRLATWGSALATVPAFWLAGSGGGTFELAIQPRVEAFVLWGHAHHDPLEWLLEHGLVGVVALGLALTWALRSPPTSGDRRSARWRPRGDVLGIGVVAVLVHGLVDFPLQIPALAIGAAVLWALRCTAFSGRERARPRAVRTLLVAACALQLAAAAWEVRSAAVARAVDRVWSLGPDAGGRATLARLAPWRPEGPLLDAWGALERGDLAEASAGARAIAADHPHDYRALRAAARVLARSGAADEAWAVYGRALERFPGDWRTGVARAADAPPDRRVDAWRDAFAGGAPAAFLPRAWATLPVGLVWVEAAGARDAAFSEKLGVFLEPRDADVAALAYEQARLLDPDRYPAGYAGVLVRLGRLEEAGAYLAEAVAARPEDLRLKRREAELMEARGHWEEAAEIWFAAGPALDGAVARGLQALARAEGAAAALQAADRLELSGRLDGQAALVVAGLERQTGDFESCEATLEAAGLLTSVRFGARARSLRASCAEGRR